MGKIYLMSSEPSEARIRLPDGASSSWSALGVLQLAKHIAYKNGGGY